MLGREQAHCQHLCTCHHLLAEDCWVLLSQMLGSWSLSYPSLPGLLGTLNALVSVTVSEEACSAVVGSSNYCALRDALASHSATFSVGVSVSMPSPWLHRLVRAFEWQDLLLDSRHHLRAAKSARDSSSERRTDFEDCRLHFCKQA